MKIKNIIYAVIFITLLSNFYLPIERVLAQMDSELYPKTADQALEEILEPTKTGLFSKIKEFIVDLPNKITELGFDKIKNFALNIFEIISEWFENTTGISLGEVWGLVSKLLIWIFEFVKGLIDRII
jgi:hypothetical protein